MTDLFSVLLEMRSGQVASEINHKNLNPEQKNPWADDANVKVFGATAHKHERAALLVEAQKWTAARYRVTAWKRNRHGSYVDERVQKQFPIPRRPT